MKLENPGYRLSQRQDRGTIYGSFEWKIRLQLSKWYCYKPIVLATPKILRIANETFTQIPKGFKISVTR